MANIPLCTWTTSSFYIHCLARCSSCPGPAEPSEEPQFKLWKGSVVRALGIRSWLEATPMTSQTAHWHKVAIPGFTSTWSQAQTSLFFHFVFKSLAETTSLQSPGLCFARRGPSRAGSLSEAALPSGSGALQWWWREETPSREFQLCGNESSIL